jgi:hypothetical protein
MLIKFFIEQITKIGRMWSALSVTKSQTTPMTDLSTALIADPRENITIASNPLGQGEVMNAGLFRPLLQDQASRMYEQHAQQYEMFRYDQPIQSPGDFVEPDAASVRAERDSNPIFLSENSENFITFNATGVDDPFEMVIRGLHKRRDVLKRPLPEDSTERIIEMNKRIENILSQVEEQINEQ